MILKIKIRKIKKPLKDGSYFVKFHSIKEKGKGKNKYCELTFDLLNNNTTKEN